MDATLNAGLCARVCLVCVALLLTTVSEGEAYLFGVTYSPYRTFGACPSDAEIREDVGMLLQHARRIRIYSLECDNVNRILMEEANKGTLSLMLGVWLDNRGTDQKEIDTLFALLRQYPSADIYGICVGNEAIFRGTLSAGEIAGRITEVRNTVHSQSYEMNMPWLRMIPIYTMEAFVHDEVVAVSDRVGINIHPFYHSNLSSSQDSETMSDMAVKRAFNTLDIMRAVSHGKEVVIGEIGWPTAATSQDMPASVDIAKKFMDKFTAQAGSHGAQYFWFELFDSSWKYQLVGQDWNKPDLHFGMYYPDRHTKKW
ncbi:hypothetical protein BSKO_05039 [Bryopsis sp. KO-2023]|nr:hypothetical protein BSKO_05039 [Bryopsis sp. KO-2023]